MSISYFLLISRQGKLRLSKWFVTLQSKEKQKIIKDVTQLILSRRPKMCNVVEYKDSKFVYKKYASLYFVAGLEPDANELLALEVIHRYVEILDRYFGNVCELDLIFEFQKAYNILDELIVGGALVESSKRQVLRSITEQDNLKEKESEETSFLAF